MTRHRFTKWIYLPVEIQYRAFDSKLLLACFAALRGYNIIIGEQVRLLRLLKILPPGLYFDKSLAQAKKDQFAAIARSGHKIVSLDEEGLSSFMAERYNHERFSSENLCLAKAIFTWGEFEKKTIEKDYPNFSAKLHPTGNPRVDLWRSDFKRIYDGRAEDLRRRYGRFFLFPSNFGPPAYPARTGIEYSLLYNRGDLNSEESIAFFFDMLAHHTRTFSNYCGLIREVASAFPEWKVIVRPHPYEGDSYWIRKLRGCCGNVLIEHDGPITPYLMAADAVVHHGCTTAVEAYCIGTPAIAYLPDFQEDYDANIATALSVRVENWQAVLDLLRDIVSRTFRSPADAIQIAESNLVNFREADACRRIMNIIDSIELKRFSLPSRIRANAKAMEAGHATLFLMFHSAMALLRRVIPKYVLPIESRYPKWSQCPLETVRKKVALYASVKPEFHDVQVEKISKYLFWVSPRV